MVRTVKLARLGSAVPAASPVTVMGPSALHAAGHAHGIRLELGAQECEAMYPMTASASRLMAYRSESGSSWETRHSPCCLSQ